MTIIETSGVIVMQRSELEAIIAATAKKAVGEALARLPRAESPRPPPDTWDGAEEWERLAFELCADEHGEESCNELIWSDNEPWGDRWLEYEDEAKRMISLVRKHTAPVAAPQQPVSMETVYDTIIEWSTAGKGSRRELARRMIALFAAPQREWQGLTPDEINNCAGAEIYPSSWAMTFARAIESKLKEKNHG